MKRFSLLEAIKMLNRRIKEFVSLIFIYRWSRCASKFSITTLPSQTNYLISFEQRTTVERWESVLFRTRKLNCQPALIFLFNLNSDNGRFCEKSKKCIKRFVRCKFKISKKFPLYQWKSSPKKSFFSALKWWLLVFLLF